MFSDPDLRPLCGLCSHFDKCKGSVTREFLLGSNLVCIDFSFINDGYLNDYDIYYKFIITYDTICAFKLEFTYIFNVDDDKITDIVVHCSNNNVDVAKVVAIFSHFVEEKGNIDKDLVETLLRLIESKNKLVKKST